MNGELGTLQPEIALFPLKPHEQKAAEAKSNQTVETVVTEIRVFETETRFARLKKTLRKRSRSIL